MIGLALEGGGSRGAYQIGVMKAYIEAGYDFNGFTGTSIGAINAAAFAQGDFSTAAEMWTNLTTEKLFDADACRILKITESKLDTVMLSKARNSLRRIIEEHGIDTSKIREIVNNFISEQKIRDSGKDYGLVTLSISERRHYELFLEDIRQGELLSYIAASACVPGFQSVVINENTFIDGALYDSCPINMLIKKGYNEIIAVRTKAPGVFRKVKAPKGVKVRIIVPTHDMGSILAFSPEKIRENIEVGYRDGQKSLRG